MTINIQQLGETIRTSFTQDRFREVIRASFDESVGLSEAQKQLLMDADTVPHENTGEHEFLSRASGQSWSGALAHYLYDAVQKTEQAISNLATADQFQDNPKFTDRVAEMRANADATFAAALEIIPQNIRNYAVILGIQDGDVFDKFTDELHERVIKPLETYMEGKDAEPHKEGIEYFDTEIPPVTWSSLSGQEGDFRPPGS